MRELIGVVAALPVEYDEQGSDGRLAQIFLDQIALMREARFSLPIRTWFPAHRRASLQMTSPLLMSHQLGDWLEYMEKRRSKRR